MITPLPLDQVPALRALFTECEAPELEKARTELLHDIALLFVRCWEFGHAMAQREAHDLPVM